MRRTGSRWTTGPTTVFLASAWRQIPASPWPSVTRTPGTSSSPLPDVSSASRWSSAAKPLPVRLCWRRCEGVWRRQTGRLAGLGGFQPQVRRICTRVTGSSARCKTTSLRCACWLTRSWFCASTTRRLTVMWMLVTSSNPVVMTTDGIFMPPSWWSSATHGPASSATPRSVCLVSQPCVSPPPSPRSGRFCASSRARMPGQRRSSLCCGKSGRRGGARSSSSASHFTKNHRITSCPCRSPLATRRRLVSGRTRLFSCSCTRPLRSILMARLPGRFSSSSANGTCRAAPSETTASRGLRCWNLLECCVRAPDPSSCGG